MSAGATARPWTLEGPASITTVTFVPSTLIEGEASTMSDFHMPDSWYDPPDDACEKCEGEGCHLCDRQMAEDYRWSTDPRV